MKPLVLDIYGIIWNMELNKGHLKLKDSNKDNENYKKLSKYRKDLHTHILTKDTHDVFLDPSWILLSMKVTPII